jgi:predicted branched-subunit amino acid permease
MGAMSETRDTHDTPALGQVVSSLALAVGAYGVAFGALGTALGLPVAVVLGMSLAVYAGGSQMALLGVLATGGAPLAGALGGLAVNSRFVAFGAAAAPLLGGSPARRLLAAYLLTDEAATVALAQPTPALQRRAFWVTGGSLWAVWQLTTAAGAALGGAVADPATVGLDVAFPAAFVVLLAPMLRGRPELAAAVGGAAGALLGALLLPPGLPVLVAMGGGVAAGVLAARAGDPGEDRPNEDTAAGDTPTDVLGGPALAPPSPDLAGAA